MPDIDEIQEQLKYIAISSGDARLPELQKLRDETDPDLLVTALNLHTRIRGCDEESGPVMGSILAYTIKHGINDKKLEFIQALVDSGANIEGTHLLIGPLDNRQHLQLSHVCALMGQADVLEYLIIESPPQIEALTNFGYSLLDFIPYDLSTWLAFITPLNKHNKLNSLCLTNKDKAYNIFNTLLNEPNGVEIAYALYLYASESYKQISINRNSLNILANYILANPYAYDMFARAATLNEHSQAINACSTEKIRGGIFSAPPNRFNIIKHTDSSASPIVIKAINDFVNLVLCNHDNLAKLLSQLNERLVAELTQQGVIDSFHSASHEFTILSITGYDFPIPHVEYQKLQKKSCLERVLLTLLRSEDMGQQSRKWFGHIPEALANPMIRNGDLFLESQFGIGVLHGKFSHMIQWALLILGIRENIIKTEPGITPKSIINYLINHRTETPAGNISLFSITMDVQYRTSNTFQDPYRLCSLISTGKFTNHCRVLEVYLRDSFCSSYLQWLRAFNAESQCQVTPHAFSTLLNLSSTNKFIPSTYAIQAHNELVLKKSNSGKSNIHGFFSHLQKIDEAYAILEKDYFSEKKFRAPRK